MGEAFIHNHRGSVYDPTKLPEFTYTGQYRAETDGNGWSIRFLSSGKLTLDVDVVVDAFLVGGGGSGAAPKVGRGGGGGGGYTKTQKKQLLIGGTGYDIVIGAGGASVSALQGSGIRGGTTSAFSLWAEGGYGPTYTEGESGTWGGSGGSGGGGGTHLGASGTYNGGDGGSNGGNGGDGSMNDGSCLGGQGVGKTTRAFGEMNGELFSGGGGGGNGGLGGDGGGGDGCQNNRAAENGDPNTGGGGGGGKDANYGDNTARASGAGGSGIVIIRNAREAA